MRPPVCVRSWSYIPQRRICSVVLPENFPKQQKDILTTVIISSLFSVSFREKCQSECEALLAASPELVIDIGEPKENMEKS